MFRRARLAFAVLITLFGVSACETASSPPPMQSLTFRDKTLLRLDVARIEFASQYTPPLKAPNVEHRFPVPPADAVQVWVKDRLQAAGKDRVLRVLVREGSVIEEKLPVDTGFKGLFKKEQEARYTATLEVEMAILDERNIPKDFAAARVIRARTMPEGLSLNERERQWLDLIRDMMADFNGEIERNMRQYMAPYIL